MSSVGSVTLMTVVCNWYIPVGSVSSDAMWKCVIRCNVEGRYQGYSSGYICGGTGAADYRSENGSPTRVLVGSHNHAIVPVATACICRLESYRFMIQRWKKIPGSPMLLSLIQKSLGLPPAAGPPVAWHLVCGPLILFNTANRLTLLLSLLISTAAHLPAGAIRRARHLTAKLFFLSIDKSKFTSQKNTKFIIHMRVHDLIP